MKRLIAAVMAALAWICPRAALVDTISIATPLVPGDPVKAVVIMPEGAPAGTLYPTVYLLNGHGGNHKSWLEQCQPRLKELSDVYGMVMVMPDGRNSWYWDSPAEPSMKMETFVTSVLVPCIDDRYPTMRDASKRAVTGYSMGGQGAMYLGIRHPEIFGNIGSTSGGVDIRPFPGNWGMSKWLGPESENQTVWDEHSIVEMVPQIKPGTLNIIFDCGVDDFFYGVNMNLHNALSEAKVPHDFISRPGAHTRDYWSNAILFQLVFFDQAFKN